MYFEVIPFGIDQHIQFCGKSDTYEDVVHLRYFIKLERIHEYNWGSFLSGVLLLQTNKGWYTKDSKVDKKQLSIYGKFFAPLLVLIS